MMTLAPQIAVRPKPYECDHPLRTEIMLLGDPPRKWVDGANLEAALHTGTDYLLILDGDCPFEETLYIHYLDQDLNPLDLATIFAMYCPSFFKNLKITGPRTCEFNFFNDEDRFEIKIHHHKKWRIPVSFPLSIIKRRISLMKWISVQRIIGDLSVPYP